MKEYQRKAQKKYKAKRYNTDKAYRDRCQQINKKWRENNKDQCKAIGKENKKRRSSQAKAYAREWSRTHPEQVLVTQSKSRAKRKNIEHTITPIDIVIPKYCPVFNQLLIPGDRKWAPSIDRIDNTRGYTKDNIMIISRRANELKRDATLKEMQILSSFYTQYLNK